MRTFTWQSGANTLTGGTVVSTMVDETVSFDVDLSFEIDLEGTTYDINLDGVIVGGWTFDNNLRMGLQEVPELRSLVLLGVAAV